MIKLAALTMLMTVFTVQDDIELETLPDYYSMLKVAPTASVHEIKKSFRKLAMKYHPDKNKEDYAQEVFQELSEAYSILSDSEKRRDYDELFLDEDELAAQYADSSEKEPASSESADSSTIETAARAEPQTEQEPADDLDEESTGEEVWGDLDDETLFKVLKFLADHDYEITKKTTKADSQFSQGNDKFDANSRQRRSAQFGQYGSSTRFGHQYGSDRTDRSNYRSDSNGHYYKLYESEQTGRSYCRTSVRWESGVKVTNKSCY